MRRARLSFLVVLMFVAAGVGPGSADEIRELRNEIKALQDQMQTMMEQHQAQIRTLQQRLDELEFERGQVAEAPPSIEKRVAALEEKTQETGAGGLLSLKGKRLEIGGKLEVEFVDTQGFAGVDEAKAHFQMDKFSLIPKVHFNDHHYLYADIEFYSSSMLTKYTYMHFGDLPRKTFLRMGFDERFMTPSRKTERYPLAGNAFWRDNSAGLFAGGDPGPLYWRLSYTNGYEMNKREVTEDNSFDMLHDNLRTSGYPGQGEWGLGLGWKKDLSSKGKLDLLGFGYFGRLSQADQDYLNANVTGYGSTSRRKGRYGLNTNYTCGPATLFLQGLKAEDGALSRLAWYVQPSYKITLGKRDFFYAVEPLFRFGQLWADIDPATGDPLTWDREEFTFALITDIYRDIKLKTEYTIDHVDKGPGGTKNYGEFLAQLEVRF